MRYLCSIFFCLLISIFFIPKNSIAQSIASKFIGLPKVELEKRIKKWGGYYVTSYKDYDQSWATSVEYDNLSIIDGCSNINPTAKVLVYYDAETEDEICRAVFVYPHFTVLDSCIQISLDNTIFYDYIEPGVWSDIETGTLVVRENTTTGIGIFYLNVSTRDFHLFID